MIEYLKDWRVWVAAIIIIIAIVWVMVKLESKTRTRTCTSTSAVTETVSDTITEEVVAPQLQDSIVQYAPIDITKDETHEIEVYEAEMERSPGQSKGEHACVVAMGKIFGEVPRVRVRDLEGLRNPLTGRILELDVFVPSRMVACEYHGEQHYVNVPRFHRGKDTLDYQQWKDQFKIDQCDKMGIFLVTVPYMVPIESIEDFIRAELIKGGVLPREIAN